MDNKNNILKAVAAVLIAVVSLVGIFFGLKEEEKEPEKEIELTSEIYNVGYTEDVYNRTVVVAERSELEDYLNHFYNTNEILDKYDDNYFKDKSLALIYEITGNGAISIKVNSLEIVGKTLQIKYSKEATAEVGTTDMSGFLIVVEVPKSVTSIGN